MMAAVRQMAAAGAARGIGPGRCMFRPALFWQHVDGDHVCDSGLDIKLDMSGEGKTAARLMQKGFDINDGEHDAALADAVRKQTAVVPDAEGRGDHAVVAEKLAAAATWGDVEKVGEILRTCYVTRAAALPGLAGAAEEGHEGVIELLLQAGVPPADADPSRGGKLNSLHVAAAAGQEASATLLVIAMGSMAEFETQTQAGRSAVDLLRDADMGGVARRLEAVAKSAFEQR